MLEVKKGQKAKFNGVLLDNAEYEDYKKIIKMLDTFKTYKKDYDVTYKSYYM